MSKGPVPFDQGLFLMYLHKGKEYFDHDELQKARVELEAAYNLRPQDEKVLNMLGMTYYKLEMLPEAEAMYVVLAGGNPEVYALQSNLGLIQLKLNKLAAARDSLNRALELQPANSKAHFYMGLLCEKEELWEDALYHFEQAKADKMVAKMRIRMEDARNKPELVLPFHVVEVLEQTESPTLDSDLAGVISNSMLQPGDSAADAETTGRIRPHDLAEAMFELHQEEIANAETDGLVPESHESGLNETEDPLKTVYIEAQEPLGTLQELMMDEPSDLMAEKMKEEIQVESELWETHPSLFQEQLGGSEILPQLESNFLVGSTIDEPFLLSDEIAADISTFLAQSRTQENPEEDVFYNEPKIPEFTVLRGTEQEPAGADVPGTEQEIRIPTPEEVENAVTEPLDPPSQDTLLPEENYPAEASPDQHLNLPVEEPVEDLSDEVSGVEFHQDSAEPADEEPQDEDLEVNFAVTDGEEEGVEEGFLQPSPLTPNVEEEELEQTQDMADTMNRPVRAILSPAEPEPVEKPLLETVGEEPSQQMEPAAEPVEAAPEQNESTESQTEAATAPEEPEVVELPAAVANEPSSAEIYHPANLDQFSKDRVSIQPLTGSDRFWLMDPHLLEIILSDKLICRIGTISSYTGNLQFVPIADQAALPLIQVEGSGILFLADRRKEIFLISLNNEVIHVESNHLLAAQSTLQIEPQFFQQNSRPGQAFAVVKISGRGTLALTCQTKPLTVNVHQGLPANIPAQAVIAWSGNVTSEILDDEDLRKVMMMSDDALFLRFRGAGDVVVEQGGLWGDRRTKRP